MDDDHFFFGHFADGVFGAFFTESAGFDPAVGHEVRAPLGGPVDVEVAAIDFAGEAEGAVDVLREDARGEAVLGVVGEGEGCIERGDRSDGDGGAEEFFATDAHAGRDLGNDRGGVDGPGAGATAFDSGTGGDGFADPGFDSLGIGFADHGSDFGVGSHLISSFQGGDFGTESIEEIGGDGLSGDDALGGDTGLSGVGVACGSNRSGGFFEIGVVEDDDGAIAAEFHGDSFDSGHAADFFTDGVAAGEADLADSRISADRFAEEGAGTGDAGDGFGGETGFEEDFDEFESREGSISCGFDDNAVAGGDGGSDFVANEIEGEVEGGDGGDDATGDAERETEFSLNAGRGVEGDHLTDDAAGLLGGDFDDFPSASGFESTFGEDFAFLQTDGASEFFLAFEHE